VVQKVAGPHSDFEMIIAQVLAVRGKDALVRTAPHPGTQTAEDEQVVKRQAGAGERGLPAVRVRRRRRRRRREAMVTIEHHGHRTHAGLKVQDRSRPFLPLRSNRRAIPPPNLMSVVIFDRGKAII
jgi:hypothetical protein